MNEFKRGDKVKVKDNLIVDSRYNGIKFVESMEIYKGYTATVKLEIKPPKVSTSLYSLDIDGSIWNWSKDMLEPII